MIRTAFKFTLYAAIIFFLVFGISVFGEKMQQWGKEVARVGKKVVGEKPVAAIEELFTETAPRMARKLRRKMLTLKNESPGKKPSLVGSKERAQNSSQTANGPPQETISLQERNELEEILQTEDP
jgi:hypothetical protein